MSVEIHGFCEGRFLPLKAAFAANFEDGLELGASLAVMQHGQPMVDLWAGHMDIELTRPWEKDTIVLVFSTTKTPLVLSFLMLVDRGLVDLDAPVAVYWPEFAAGGKGGVTVRDVLTHQAGVPGFDPPLPFDALRDWASITAHIAAERHWFGGERRLFYHPYTFGFILGEIIRRVDGRGPARFFREEIAEKANIDFQIGLSTAADRARTAQLTILDPLPLVADEHPVIARINASLGEGDWETWEQQQAEIPAANGFANGRSIARLCAIAANGGVLDGVRYLSKAMIDEASREQAYDVEPSYGAWRLSLGFNLHDESFPAPSPTTVHWGGAGGSLCGMDQTTGISFGYAMNNLVLLTNPITDRRFQRLWSALTEVMTVAADV
jgi:CubicO group peptidase (beta-lactamase class C family)